MEERDVSGERGEVAESTEQERIQNEEEEQWIWRNGLLVRVKSRIEVLTKKVDSFNSSIERAGNADSPYLKVGSSKNKRIAQFYYRQYS